MIEQRMSATVLATALDAVYRCASNDEDRQHLSSVLIEMAGDKLITAATNGHVVAKYETSLWSPWVPGKDATYAIGKWVVDRRDVEAAIHAIRAARPQEKTYCNYCGREENRSPHDYECVFTPASAQIGIFKGEMLIVALRLVVEEFSPIDKVLPPRVKRVFDEQHIGIAPKYMRLIADCFDAAFRDPVACFFEPIGQLDPIMWSHRTEDQSLVMACMPVRDDDDCARPLDSALKLVEGGKAPTVCPL